MTNNNAESQDKLIIDVITTRSKALREEINIRIALQNRVSTELFLILTSIFIGSVGAILKIKGQTTIEWLPWILVGYVFCLELLWTNYIYQIYMIMRLACRDTALNCYVEKALNLKSLFLDCNYDVIMRERQKEKKKIEKRREKILLRLLSTFQVAPLVGMLLLVMIASFVFPYVAPNIDITKKHEVTLLLINGGLLCTACFLFFLHIWVENWGNTLIELARRDIYPDKK